MTIDKKRWIVLLLHIIILQAIQFPYFISVLAGPLNETRNWPVVTLMLVFTVAIWCYSPAMIICSKISEKIGERKLLMAVGTLYAGSIVVSAFVKSAAAFIAFGGVFAGFGMMGLMMAQLSSIGKYFPDKRGLAMGLYFGPGIALFSFLMIPVAKCINLTSVTTTIIGMGIIFGIVIVGVSFFTKDPPKGYIPEKWEEEGNPGESLLAGPEYNWIEMIKTPAFYMLFVALLGLQVGGYSMTGNVSLMAQSALGVSDTQGAFFSMLIFIGTGIGGLISGILVDKIGGGSTLLAISAVSALVLIVYLVMAQGVYSMFAAVTLVLGVGQGGYATVQASVVMNVFGVKHYGTNLGIFGIAMIISALIGPTLAGSAVVNTVFIVSMIVNMIGAAASLAYIKFEKRIFRKFESQGEQIENV